jgi:hypothetical protein
MKCGFFLGVINEWTPPLRSDDFTTTEETDIK